MGRPADNPLEVSTDPLPRRLAAGVAKISQALKQQSWHKANERGLSQTQGQILVFLLTRPKRTARLTAIAAGIGASPATASEAVSLLLDKGLVRKTQSSADARVVNVTLSPSGKREAEQAADWPEFLAVALAILSPAEQQLLLRALIKTIRTLQERGEIPVARMCVTCRHFRPNVYDDPTQPHHCAYVDAPFGDRLLRIDCAEHEPATQEDSERHWLTVCEKWNIAPALAVPAR